MWKYLGIANAYIHFVGIINPAERCSDGFAIRRK